MEIFIISSLFSGSIPKLLMESRYGNCVDFPFLFWTNVQWSGHCTKFRDPQCSADFSKLKCVQWVVTGGY